MRLMEIGYYGYNTGQLLATLKPKVRHVEWLPSMWDNLSDSGVKRSQYSENISYRPRRRRLPQAPVVVSID